MKLISIRETQFLGPAILVEYKGQFHTYFPDIACLSTVGERLSGEEREEVVNFAICKKVESTFNLL